MDEDEQVNWKYEPGGGPTAPGKNENVGGSSVKRPTQKNDDSVVAWVASEYIEHERNTSWYVLLAVITVGLAAGIYFLTKDIFATVIIAVVGLIVGVFAGRKPRQMEYELSSSGLRIGEKSYPYSLFRTFSIIKDGAINSVNLTPIKRFMPPISAYYAPKDEEQITKMLGNYLPYEESKLDSIDRLSRHLRF
jgi:hypothetical protein